MTKQNNKEPPIIKAPKYDLLFEYLEELKETIEKIEKQLLLIPISDGDLKGREILIEKSEDMYEAFLHTESKPIDLNDYKLKEFLSIHKPKDFRIWINEIKHEFIIEKEQVEMQPTPLAVLEELLIYSPNIVRSNILFNKFSCVLRDFDTKHPEQDLRVVYRWIANLRKIHEVLANNIAIIPGVGYQWKNAIKYCIIRWKYKKRRISFKAHRRG